MKPYTYLVGWPEHNIWYYGVRYSQDCDPGDLWVTYFTSSPKVKNFAETHGDPPVRQIRKLFDRAMPARLWESKVLRRLKVTDSAMWLNTNHTMAPPINPYGNLRMKEPELRAKASANNKGPKNPMYGRKQTKVSCIFCKKQIGVNAFVAFHGDKCGLINQEHKQSISKRYSGSSNPMFGKTSPLVSCMECKKVVQANNFKKWHGIKCKHNLTSLVANTDSRVYNQL